MTLSHEMTTSHAGPGSGPPGQPPSPGEEAATGAFAERVLAGCIGGITTLLAALGDRHGLFRALASGGPASPAEFAALTGIDERYGREWLAAMAAAGYLAWDPAAGTFSLPAAHVPVLAVDGTPASLGGPLQWMLGVLPTIGAVSEAMRNGNGVPPGRYSDDLWQAMERLGAPMYTAALPGEWVSELPQVHRMLAQGAAVADLGCGAGRALIALAQAYPEISCAGFDTQPAQVERAGANASKAGVAGRARFEARDAAAGLPGSYDLVLLFDVVHDAADPGALLRAARAALRPGGAALVLEIASGDTLAANLHPLGALYYGVSLLYCLPASLAAGGPGLGSLGMPESRLREMALAAGFTGVRRARDVAPAHALFELLP